MACPAVAAVAAALTLAVLMGIGAEAADSFPVRCSKNCNGLDTCLEICRGEMKQTGKCPSMAPCPKPNENTALCPSGPQPCQFSEWAPWKNDTARCSGLCIRTRAIAQANMCGGDPCKGTLTETKKCRGACDLISPQDCIFAPWVEWSACGTTTKNQRERTRTIASPPTQGGACEGPLTQTQVCPPAMSGVNCMVGMWMPWNECSSSCGGGQHIRFRTIAQRATAGGIACRQSISETAACNVGVKCGYATNCVFSAWSSWLLGVGGGGQKTRTRSVKTPSEAGGEACVGSLQETEAANLVDSTPVDCKLNEWNEWGMCDKTCGGGQTFRQRSILKPAENGGAACSGHTKETTECSTDSCALANGGANCQLSEWSAWPACSVTCGVGIQKRKRTISKQAKTGGAACSGPMETQQSCTTSPCSVEHCKWGIWGQWGDCPVTCGEGHQRRKRSIEVQASLGGDGCLSDDAAEVQRCANTACSHECIDGTWSEWGDWSECTKSCSGGYRTAKRSISTFANSCGKNATGYDLQAESCNGQVKCLGDEDCQLSKWSDWAGPAVAPPGTTTDCGNMFTRSREIAVHGMGHGKYCGTDTEGNPLVSTKMAPHLDKGVDYCNITEKTHCVLGDWGTWGACSSTCENGQAERKRQISVQPSRTGNPCEGNLTENQACNQDTPCEVQADCKWAAWGEWSTCTKCSGQKFRTRSVEQKPTGGGRPCREEASKQAKRCPKDCGTISNYFCIWSTWSAWGSCEPATDPDLDTKVCGNGTRTRKRVLGATKEQPADGDYAALAKSREECQGVRSERVDCDAGTCGPCVPQDCMLGEWREWGPATCEGMCERSRGFQQRRNLCGKPCTGSLNSTMACTASAKICVKKDCQLSSWGEWSTCQSILGQKYRARSVLHHPRNKGLACIDNMNETAPCLKKADMMDCNFEAWSAWKACDKSCGGGQKARERKVMYESNHGGAACTGLLQQTGPCNQDECVSPTFKNCELAPWGRWSSCNASSETQSYRWRHVSIAAVGSGLPCAGDLQETQSCAETDPVECRFSGWTAWAGCSTSCVGGQQQRTRSIIEYALRGGKTCRGEMIQMRPCNVDTSCEAPSDCAVKEWADWSLCSPACGNGQRQRKRFILSPPGPGGKKCPNSMAEVKACSSPACPGDVDCKWQDWQEWQPCVQAEGPCGVGYKRRNRGYAQMPANSGRQCPPRIKEELMPVQHCGGQKQCCRDGVWADWQEWATCGVTCNGGQQTRQRSLATKESWCGKPAPGTKIEYKSCNTQPCGVINCAFAAWSAWVPEDACSGPCSEGHMERTRVIEGHAHGGGEACTGATNEMKRCPYSSSCTSYKPQAVDCVVGEWSDWAACSQSCAGGYREHSRAIKVKPSYGGAACPAALKEMDVCNANVPCSSTGPAACVWDVWTHWSSCAANEEQTSSRGALTAQANGGSPCVGSKERVRPCGVCANGTYSCGWGEWADWAPCSRTCGTGGDRTRMRKLQAGEQVMDKLYDSTLPKFGKLEEPQEVARIQEMLSAFALGCISLAVALVARKVCWRRRDGASDEDCQDRGHYVEARGEAFLESGDLE